MSERYFVDLAEAIGRIAEQKTNKMNKFLYQPDKGEGVHRSF